MAATSTNSMIIDGIAASEAIDSSGEILDVDGCDISDFTSGVGLLNYEHRGDDAKGASGNDIVGKIIYARKIKKKDDCEDKRQEAYWDHVKLPFIYIKGRLYDGSDHEGAKALAAAIRDAVTHNEPILARFSIEGSTLKKEGQRLARTIARKVAITFKPANKSAISGLVSDPNAAKPVTEKQSEKTLLSQLLEQSAVKSEIPGQQYLGGHSTDLRSLEVVEDPAEALKSALRNLKALLKNDAAPSTLTGNAALAREDDRLHQFDKAKAKDGLRAAVRDLPMNARNNKAEMLKFFKFKLPEINPGFLEHFTDLIDDVRTRQVGDWVEKTMGVWEAVTKAEARGAANALKAQEAQEPEAPAPVPEKAVYTPRPENANPAEVSKPTAQGVGLSAAGSLLSAKLTKEKAKLKLYDYSKDPQFMSVLHADDASKSPDLDAETRARIIKYVHKPWERAAASWLTLNKMAAAGELPSSVIAHSAIFAAMSPNTSVPMQELYFGHYQDFAKKHGDVFLNPKGIDPKDAEHFHKWLNKTTPPEFFKEFYLQNTPEKGGIAFGQDKKQTLNPNATLEKRPQGVPLLNYHRFHPMLSALVKEVKDDGRAYVDYIMQHKEEHGANSMMPGFGPKLARYQALLMGQGNVVVPDRHFVRALFNLPEDHPHAGYLFNTLTPTRGERLLRGIDHQFNQNSPGVKKVLEKYPEHFKGREMQANALGFWLQWLCMPHYNSLRGIPTDNLNMGTAHDPYFKAVRDTLEQEGIPHDMADLSGLYKHDEVYGRQFGAPIPARVARATKKIEDGFGESAASMFFYSFGVPALLAHERMNMTDEASIRKMESLVIEIQALSKAFAEQNPIQAAVEPQAWPPTENKEVAFQGQPVKPGFATIYATPQGEHVPEGRKMAILGKTPASEGSPQGDWLMVPHEKLGIHGPGDLEKWGADGTAEIHQEPIFTQSKPGVVHASLHVPPHYAMKDYQNSMVHGLDMTPGKDEAEEPHHFHGGAAFGSWKKLPNGKMAYVKNHMSSNTAMQSSAHAEALYHNAMHHLGLQDYVTPTTLFQHPDVPPNTDVQPEDYWSASEGVQNASHYDASQKQKDALHSLHRTGELHKLALANQILGNQDRHSFNYLFGGKNGDELKLIDHGFTFPGQVNRYDASPHYMNLARIISGQKGFSDTTLHPKAREWLLGLDPRKFEEFLGKHQVPATVAYAASNKLKAMQEYATQEPNATYDEVHGWPTEKHGFGSDRFDFAAQQRAKQDPEFAARYAQRKAEAKGAREQRRQVADDKYNAISDVEQAYREAAKSGGDPDPYTILVNRLGEEEAAKAVAPASGPFEKEKLIRDFNRRIRKDFSRMKKLQELRDADKD
jgi:hypothetical protein